MSWDTIERNILGDTVTIIDASWPDDRGMFWCEDPDLNADVTGAYVLADCMGDAVESMAVHNDHEGDDDDITARGVTGEEREAITAAVRDFLAKL
jgi:hypothetical protein